MVQDLHIRVINAGTGELLRELTLNPDRDYQPTGKPAGWPKKNTANPTQVRGVLDVLRHHTLWSNVFHVTEVEDGDLPRMADAR